MKQDLSEEYIIAVKISIQFKGEKEREDTLSCLILDP